MVQRVVNKMRLLLIKILSIVFFCLSIQGCETLRDFSFTDKEEDEYAEWSAEQFNSKADKEMEAENYAKAIKLYEALETRYPFGEFAAQTQLNVAYAYYKNNEPEAAISAAERFIKIHPRNPSVDYAYYLIGLVNYNRDIGFMQRYLPTDASQRDQSNTQIAYDSFAELIRRFPESKYVPDAKQRMIALRNTMAMHEVHIARYYFRREAYVAAANRSSYVIEKYQRTPAIPYALQVLQDSYTKLGLDDLANDTARVYELNYPEGPPYPEFSKSTFSHKVWDFFGFDK